ncbi:2Fe-2S iron-sulfur cluster-binding protein [Pseudacidovorax sp. RU35E]|uniref:xanthine dehydrogenase family Fe-S subunit n=1 Tax=Pseudacidovorax sp. RU35E TaxID=1907403 RepID=UPI00095524EB|nr:2Fe-2S iron-sulfur cluster-binding protein [Pseudacidovorax sp. RU35E]SIR79048.1 carbon-monoxide dehydrogenase small subunit [Pseudacidovorax sp. RU35E]
MDPISIHVNGRSVSRAAEPRTHLADFLRDELRLTGTHLGCEHGVCGACTVLVDGQPTRSCITFAVACEGHEVTTIEGYDGDAAMQLLRQAFTRHHALQCGFCTPGMLATARDIVLRLPDADEARVRLELSGNLCRCTGYQGIVDAILDVLQQQRDTPDAQFERLRHRLTAPRTVAVQRAAAVVAADPSAPAPSKGATANPVGAADMAEVDPVAMAKAKAKGNAIEVFFDVPHPLERVWEFMGDLPAVASCLPGATVDSHEGDRVKGTIAIKFGPMSAAFAGAARLERDDAAKRAVLRGAGQDSLSKSRTQGDITYRLEALSADSTRVHVDMIYALQGPLAQFSRSGLVKDFVRRMVADFGHQISRRLSGQAGPIEGTLPTVSMAGMMWSVLWNRIRGWFGAGPRS